MNINIWDDYFAGIPRIGWELRKKRSDIWFRIHSLPDSKRYPETKVEEATLLVRHNEVAGDVLGEKSKLLLYWHHAQIDGIASIKTGDYSDELVDTELFAAEIGNWLPHKFDHIILKTARWELDQVMFMSVDSGNVYAPYDGGADIFVHDAAPRNELRARFSPWFSLREDEL